MKKNLLSLTLLLPVLLAARNPPDSLNVPKGTFGNYSPLLFTAGYRVPIGRSPVINSGHGIYLEAGINPARLITKKMIAGVFVGLAWKDNLWNTSFNKEFTRDYTTAIDREAPLNTLDSAVVTGSGSLFAEKKGTSVTMPGCEMNSFHNYSLYYGAIVKLPFKHIPFLKLYKGTTRTHYQGPGDLITKQKEYNILQLRRAMYGCEVLFVNPLAIFYHKRNVPKYLQKTGISIYYEYCNFYESQLYFDDGEQKTTVRLKNFSSQGFLNKYRNEHQYGCKISFNLF
jgi:hypothetical protein